MTGLLLEEDTPCIVAAVETEILEPNAIVDASATNSDITNTIRVYYYSNTTTLRFTINPKPEAETEDKHEDSEDDDYNEDDKVEKVEPPEDDTPDQISIEINYKDSDGK